MNTQGSLEVRAFFHLAGELGDHGRRQLAADSGATVASVAREIGLETGCLGLILVNGRKADLDDPLEAGDRVAYFPEYVPYHRVYGMCVL